MTTQGQDGGFTRVHSFGHQVIVTFQCVHALAVEPLHCTANALQVWSCKALENLQPATN